MYSQQTEDSFLFFASFFIFVGQVVRDVINVYLPTLLSLSLPPPPPKKKTNTAQHSPWKKKTWGCGRDRFRRGGVRLLFRREDDAARSAEFEL